MDIDRCYCFQKTFAELKGHAEKLQVTTVADLQEFVDFGLNCRLCHPYVRRMLRTGETIFHEIITDENEPL